MNANTETTLQALAEQVQKAGGLEALLKAYTLPSTSTQGLIAYDLEAPSKKLFPVITPLRNKIPRIGGGIGLATNWRAITALDVNSVPAGVSEGNRGGVISTTIKEYFAKYTTIGLEDYVSFEMDTASRTFEDVKALAVMNLLKAIMLQEEAAIIGGNTSVALGVTPTPTLTVNGSATDGALSIAAGGLDGSTFLHVRVVALTHAAFIRSRVVNGGGVPATLTRTNADATTDTFGGGSAGISVAATSAAVTGTATVTAVVAPVQGAVAYAWLWGNNGTTNCNLAAVTTVNRVVIKTNSVALTGIPSGYAATGTVFDGLGTQDNSANALIFDGILSIVAAANSGGYYKALDGTSGLTSDGETGIVEIDAALRSFWDTYRLGPSEILVSSQEINNITKKVVNNSGAPLIRFVGDVNRSAPGYGANNDWGPVPPSSITAGAIIGNYLNRFTMMGGNMIPVRLHPNVPPGTIIFWSDTLPYPLSNVAELMRIKTRRDYYQLEWPLRSRKYEYGVYSEEVLQCYAPFAFGYITNIADA